MIKRILGLAPALAVAITLALAAPALACGHSGGGGGHGGHDSGHDKKAVCHPVGSATGGNQHNGYSLIQPSDASSHIDESLYPSGHYWKHEHDGRHDFYAVDGNCDTDTTPPPDSTYPYEVNACWEMDNPNMADQTSIEWPQTNVDKGTKTDPAECPTDSTCEGTKFQYDWYWIRDAGDEDYFASLTVLNSPADDSALEAHNYSVVYSAPDKSKCTPPPPTDACPDLPGNQAPGTDCTPPPAPKAKAWIRVVNYCPPAGPQVEGQHNVKDWWRTHPSKSVYVIRAIAKKVTIQGQTVQALFSNGKATKTIRLHVKPLCGHSGGSS